MIISIIVAMDEKGGIGLNNRLPWRLSADMKRFKSLTMGHFVLMGRNTFASLGKPLPGRHIIVVSEPEFHPTIAIPQVSWVSSINEGITLTEGETELFISGGAQVYAQCLFLAHRIYLTRVHTVTQADVFFPDVDLRDWVVRESITYSADEKNEFPYTFQMLEKE
jgi:dihydrofolate reductase